jgi:hypothetical protein
MTAQNAPATLTKRQFFTTLASGATVFTASTIEGFADESQRVAAHGLNPLFGNFPIGAFQKSRYAWLRASSSQFWGGTSFNGNGDVINDGRLGVQTQAGWRPYGVSRIFFYEDLAKPMSRRGLNIQVYATAFFRCRNPIPTCTFFDNSLVNDGKDWRGWRTGSITNWAICYTDRGMISVPEMPTEGARKSQNPPQ